MPFARIYFNGDSSPLELRHTSLYLPRARVSTSSPGDGLLPPGHATGMTREVSVLQLFFTLITRASRLPDYILTFTTSAGVERGRALFQRDHRGGYIRTIPVRR